MAEFDGTDVRRAFKLLVKLHGDADKDMIPIPEFKTAMQKLAMDDKVSVDFTKLGNLMKLIDNADKDGNGLIDGSEFNVMMRGGFISAEVLYDYYMPSNPQVAMSEDLESLIVRCFEELDENQSGAVDQTELRTLFKGKGGVTQAVWIHHFDIDRIDLTLETLIEGIKAVLQSEEAEEKGLSQMLQDKLNEIQTKKSEQEAAGEACIDVHHEDEEEDAKGEGCCASGCLTKKILSLQRAEIRRACRSGNIVAAFFILTAVVIGFRFERDSFASVVLQVYLGLFGLLFLLLEVRIKVLDAFLRDVLHYFYYAKGKAVFLVFLGVGCYGCGPGGVVLGTCVAAWGIVSYYCLKVHTSIGLYFSTTQADRAELIEKASKALAVAEKEESREDILACQAKLEMLGNRAETPEEQFALERAVLAAENVPLPLFSKYMQLLEKVEERKRVEMAALTPSRPIGNEPISPGIGAMVVHSDPAVEPEAVHVNTAFDAKNDPVSPASAAAPLAGETALDEDALPKPEEVPTAHDVTPQLLSSWKPA
eukprot:TRINITY_DN8376_c0_g1_i2.p1 TRINITY_DN8376_c0_g1~~TRINITY_DN8376_c0_g1_i2.p1  ORF type:complete len:536 (-),score=136.53 TRINITY_DN8376_c0_g1_i2:382-1989(-)